MPLSDEKLLALRSLLADISTFSRGLFPRYKLRSYQAGPVQAVIEAIRAGQGGSFVWVFSRQAGKDETLAQLLAYLLNLYQLQGGQIVVGAPTVRQAQISRERLINRLDNGLNRGKWRQDGYIVRLGKANARFLSAAPTSNVRGETASLLLVANETQDIEAERWDAVFDPMAASTNAVTLYLGTVWTSRTLLARQMRHLSELEKADGRRRIFKVDWREVAKELPAYGARVEARIQQFGENHPFIRTEYELKELDGSGGLFNSERRALMVGSHSRQAGAQGGRVYCLLVDVAGGEESEGLIDDVEVRAAAGRRDSTVVTVVEVDNQGGQASGGLPLYRVVARYEWVGVAPSLLHARLVGLASSTWGARFVVVDSTGIGAGLASFLSKSLPNKVIPFVFSQQSKSELGWSFVGIIESGRYKDYAIDNQPETLRFWKQLEAVEYEVRPGPGHIMRWSVPDPLLHDDLVMSAALVAVLDGQDWRSRKAVGLATRL